MVIDSITKHVFASVEGIFFKFYEDTLDIKSH